MKIKRIEIEFAKLVFYLQLILHGIFIILLFVGGVFEATNEQNPFFYLITIALVVFYAYLIRITIYIPLIALKELLDKEKRQYNDNKRKR